MLFPRRDGRRGQSHSPEIKRDAGSTRFSVPRYINALEEDYAETLGLLDKQLEVCPPEEKPGVHLAEGVLSRLARGPEGSLDDLLLAGELAGAMRRKERWLSHVIRSWNYLDQHALALAGNPLRNITPTA